MTTPDNAAPPPAPTPSGPLLVALDYAIQHGWPSESLSKIARIRSADLAAPLASEPEPVAAEQAREVWAISDGYAWLAMRDSLDDAVSWVNAASDEHRSQASKPPRYQIAHFTETALASQSTPPPESAGQGLSDAVDAKRYRFMRQNIDYTEDPEDGSGYYWHNQRGEFEYFIDGGKKPSFEQVIDAAILAANRTAQPDGGSKA